MPSFEAAHCAVFRVLYTSIRSVGKEKENVESDETIYKNYESDSQYIIDDEKSKMRRKV